MKIFICLVIVAIAVVARRHHRITTTKECYARSGTCYMRSDNEDCPSNTSITLGRCDTRGSGCCFNRDDFCEAKNGTCGLTTHECLVKEDYRPSYIKCSDNSRCCVYKSGRGHKGGRHTRIRTSEQCNSNNGTCSTRSDCNTDSNVFIGKCDEKRTHCCLGKDILCAKYKGECMQLDMCNNQKHYRPARFNCTGDEGVCCLPHRHNIDLSIDV